LGKISIPVASGQRAQRGSLEVIQQVWESAAQVGGGFIRSESPKSLPWHKPELLYSANGLPPCEFHSFAVGTCSLSCRYPEKSFSLEFSCLAPIGTIHISGCPGLQPVCRITQEQVRSRVLCESPSTKGDPYARLMIRRFVLLTDRGPVLFLGSEDAVTVCHQIGVCACHQDCHSRIGKRI
jgi:hypothetical protein